MKLSLVLAFALLLAAVLGLKGAVAAPLEFVVNSTVDATDANVGDGLCRTSAGTCTLRAATQEANAHAGLDAIRILPGTYAITIAPINENAANVGDFEITDPVTIQKADGYLGDVVIDAGDPLPSSPLIARGLDRIFEIHPGAGDVTLRNLTLQNGYHPEEGGAIQNWSLGKLTLDAVTVKDSYAEKAGGGLNHADVNDYPWTTEPPNLALLPHGRVEIKRSIFMGNGTSDGGAAINNVSGGTITISDQSVITLNPGAIKPDPLDPEEFVLVDPSDYPLAASAISNQARWQKAGTFKISNSTVSLNASEDPGAGISSWGDSVVTIENNSKLTQNRTASEGGGLFTEGGKVSVTESEVSKNQAANGGGLYSGGHVSQYGLRGRIDVKNANVFENKAENGGGIYNGDEAQLFVTDTTFTKNLSSDHGAAISSSDRSNLTLTRVNVVENESNGEGGGVWTHSERQHTIVDSVFSANKAGVPMIEDGVLSDDVAGGGALHTEGGPLTILRTTFDGNSATEEGGGISMHNFGDVVVTDSVLKNNRAYDGGGTENSATRVTFERVTVQGNRAGNAGGGIHNTSSGEFKILDSTIRDNVGVIGGGMANAPDNHLIVRGSLFLNNSARIARNDEGIIEEEAGKGGGLMSFADGESLIENTTFSGNKAASAGGGLFHDADGELRLVHITVWRNAAPAGGAIGVVESDFVPPIPPAANSSVIVKNSIVGGSVNGAASCDWYVRSEGGNLETGDKNTCFLAVTAETAESPIELGVRDRRGDPKLLAIADNGGPTLTHALQWGSLAIDSSDVPCSVVDQRGTERPQNGKCDAGAYEFVGLPPPYDATPPETYFEPGVDGPRQDSFETMAFTFRGDDNLTPAHELNFECRFFEIDLAEQQDPVAPWDPIPPEFRWNGCSSPWSTILFEEGMMNFEVRAIDRAGNVDPTPVKYILSADNMQPPDTIILEKPPAQTNNRSALFSFAGISDFTPPQWFEYECRLDSNDPEMWLECFNPAMYSNLSTGLHTFEVRAATEVGGFEGDPTPARYTWRVGPDPNNPTATPPLSCDEANVTVTASADGWADQVTPLEGYMFHTELEVRSDATDPGNGAPIVPQNARAFFRFPISNDAPDCELVSATLRLYAGGHTEGRTLEAVPLEDTWKESTLNWDSQPDPYPGAAAATTQAGELYREWDVKSHVEAILGGDLPNNGWVIRDQHESDAVEGGDQSFVSREMPQDPPDVTLPELELRFEAADTGPPPDRDQTLVDRAVECGERITESTRLTADVTGCLGEGISIGSPNVILDLNGHTVRSGLVLEPGEEDMLIPGIRVNQSNVEIRGPGVVTNFGHGVLLGPGATHGLVQGLTLYKNALSGVQLFDADNGRIGNVVRGNRFDSNGETGLQLMSGAEGSTIEDNFFVSNGMSIHVNSAHRNLIRNNEISGIILDPLLDSDAGIVLENGARDNVLEGNDVSDTGDAGIKIHMGSHGTKVVGGVLVRNGDAGVIVENSDRAEIDGVLSHQQSDGGVVLGNSSGSTVKNGQLQYNPSGVSASNTNGLVVAGNDVSHSLQAGIELGNGIGMKVLNNTANLTGGSGISLEGVAADANGVAVGGALIEGNTANQNAQDGLSIAVGKHTIGGNDAHNNAGFGIAAGEADAADPLVANIDGGGNRATGNAEAVQCLGVVCDESGSVPVVPEDLTAPETLITGGPLGPPPPPADGSTGSETAVFTFSGNDGPTGAAPTALVFECRLDAPPDPVEPVEPELEPPDPTDPELPEPPEGENWGECVSPHTLLSLEPGQHKFEVRAVDWAGNFDVTPAVYIWTIHAGVDDEGQNENPPVPPDTRITAAPGELITDEAGTRYDTTNRAATFRFAGSDNLTAGYNLVYECRLYYNEFNDELTPADMPSEDVLPFGPCASPKQYAALDYGGHIFEVRAVDLAGNKDVTPAWHSWWIHPPPPDIGPPDTTITSGPDATTVLTSATFEFTGSDNQTPLEELAFECRLDGATQDGQPLWTECSSPYVVSVSSPASATEHVLQVRAVDLAGNVDDVNGTTADSLPDGVPAAYVWTVGPTPVPKTVFCGQKITQSIIVNNNLGDCIGHGLIVGANAITIDLNGKTIDGKSIGAGILNNGFDSVTIKNGRLIDFDYGVMLNAGSKLNIVEGVIAEKNQDAGVALGQQTWPEDPNLAPSQPVAGFLSGVDENILRSNTLVANSRGVWLMNGAKDNVTRGNLIGATSGDAVWVERASENLIEGNDLEVAGKHAVLLEGAENNTVRDNSIVTAGTGIRIGATTTGTTTGIESSGNRVVGNLLTDTAGPALEIDSSHDNELVDNVATLSDSDAIELYLANDNVVRGNDVSGNKGGISLRGSTGNLIEANDASDSDSTGIVLQSQSLSNVLRANTSSGNGGGGISIGDETPAGQGTLVEGNTTNGNTGMGIQASKPSHIFKDNVAFDNGNWGIHAGDPSNGRANVDGGGNIAQGNDGPLGVDLKPQQCYNVRCTGGPGGGDQIAPNTSLLETPLDPSAESVAVFRFTGADNLSPVTYQCRFESTLESAWEPCASPKTYNNLGNGEYTFEVRALDFSGNVDPTPASHTWNVALGDFKASIDSTPAKVTVSTQATFEFSANRDAGVTFQCVVQPAGGAVDWASAPACTSPKTYGGLEPGEYEFWLRASDAASNYDTKMYAWTVGPPPVVAEVNCGQILTQSTKVLNDLVDCGGYGLIVGAPGITIDLDGHIIDGQGLDAGILNNGHDDVTTLNGMVSQFLYGVQLNPGTARNVVHSLRLEGNAEAAVALSDADQGADGNTIRDNSIMANQVGIALYNGTRHAVIRDNTFAANRGLGSILLEFASENLIEGNQIGQSGASGVYMVGGGSNTISENAIKDSGGFGINAGDELLMSNNNLVQRNTIQNGGGGMIVAGNGNSIVNNTATGTTGPAVLVDLATDTLVKGNDFGGNASGISVAESTGTIVEANNASGTLGSGIAIEELSMDTIVRDNTASGNKGDGIEVTESSVIDRGALIERNTADANGGDGISVEGAGHTIKDNVAQMNGGWGIYSVGGIDGGGNFAAGNMELDQCFNVVCELGTVPGAPDTWIVSGPADVDTATPGIQSNSRNASFTYMGADEFSPITEIVFECRIDSTSPTAWQDCEYPAEFLNLSPGEHTVDIRAIDMLGQGLADPTPATFTWTYVPLPFGVAPEVILDVKPPAETYLMDAVFTFHSNEPDVTFQCKVDANGWQPCGFEGAAEMNMGAFEWQLLEEEVGPHTFYVRAIDFEGNVGEPTTYTWRLLGITVVVTDGPGFVPATGGPQGQPATGGPVQSTSAEIHFEAVPDPGDVTFWCRFDSLDPNGFFPCTSPFRVGPEHAGNTSFPEPLLPGDHMLEVYATSESIASAAELEAAEYEWEVLDPLDNTPPETTIERAPGPADMSSTIFEFSGVDDLTPTFVLTYECQVTAGTAPPNGSEWVLCTSPFNLLDAYTYADPEMLLTEHTFYVRAIDAVEPEVPNPQQPDFEGNPDPTPATFTWTPVADTRAPSATVSAGPANGAVVAEPEPYEFFGTDNATPALRLTFECAVLQAPLGLDAAEWQSCSSPHSVGGLEPGEYTFAVRAVDLMNNAGPAATRALKVVGAPVVTILSGPNGRLDPITGEPSLPFSSTESAVFTFKADQPGVTFECSVDGAEFEPCNTLAGTGEGVFAHAAWVVLSGQHEFAVRATNAQGILGEETLYEWMVELGPDVTAPDTKILTGPTNGTLDTVATFTFTGSDNRSRPADLSFECALDSTTSWNSCTSPEQYSDLVRGSHTLRVRAVDASGNMDTSPAVYTWIVAPPPIVTITSGPGVDVEESTSTTATFEFTSDVAGATYHCWLDGKFNPAQPGDPSQPAPCASGQMYENLGYGPHLFAVRAVDSFGNIGEWEDAEFTVLPPQAVFTSVPASETSTSATFEFTSDPLDPNAEFYCSLDGRPFGVCTSPKTYTNLWPGEHTFQVQTVYTGVDWRGEPLEFDPVPASHTWTVVDLTPPETTIEFGPPATTMSTSAYLGVSSDDPTATIECALNGVLQDCELGGVTELTDLTPGSYTFTAQATDPSGNVDSSPASYSWTVQAPTGDPNTPVGDNVVVSLPLPNGAGNATVTFFSVETAGFTTLDALAGGPPLPEGYGGGSASIYDISTTAAFSEPVTVCLPYNPLDYGSPTPSVRLLHFDGELWLDITTLNNPFSTPGRICGEAESFSLFAIALASSGMEPQAYILSGPDGAPNAEGIPTSTRGSATFEFWVDQPNAVTQCSIDGQPYVFCESPYTVGPLAAGEHDFMVQAINDFGWVDLTPALYEWEIIGPDTTPPTTTITKGPPEGSSTPNFISTFEFSGTDDFTPPLEFDFLCTLDGVDIGNCETPEEIEVTTPGQHTLRVQAIDEAGNVDPVGATRNWTVVDMSGPDTEITLGPVEETTETTATFEFEGFEILDGTPVTQFECALDEGDFTACTPPHTITGVTEGAHVFHVRAVDPDGNRDISPDYYEWLVLPGSDTTPPDTFIVFSPEAGNSGPDVTFGFASNEPVEMFECAWGAGTPPAAPTTWEQCEAVFFLAGLPSGPHWLWVRAIDPALNVDPTPAPGEQPFVWVVNAEPDTFITRAPENPTGEFSAEFVFESDQAGVTFECSVDGSAWTSCRSSEQEPYVAGPFLPDVNGGPMEHTFEVRAINQYLDANGERVMDLSPATYEWAVQDVTPPDTEFLGVDELGPAQFLEPGLRFKFRGDDDFASSFELTFECALDNTADAEAPVWEQCGEPGANDSFFHEIAFVDLAAGPYTFQVRAVDVAGNVDETGAPEPAYEFVVEGEPETTITSVVPDIAATNFETTSTSVTFTFTGTGASFLCRLDEESAPFVECPGGVAGQATYTDIPYGEHLFEVMAVGEFGTPDLSPAQFQWVSGTDVAPDVTITNAPATGTESTTATFEFSSTDPTASFLCSLDGSPQLPCSSPQEYTGLRAGEQNPHTFEVEATNATLLESVPRNSAIHEWTITDAAGPNTILLPPPPPDPSGADVEFRFSGTDNGTLPADLDFECRLDGVDPFAPCSSPYPISALTGGEHTFEVRAIDLAGNVEDTPASYTWTAQVGPETTIDSAPENPSPSSTATFSFSSPEAGVTFQCSLDSGPFAACTSPREYTQLLNGSHRFEVRAVKDGLVDETPAVYDWAVADQTPPETTIDSGPEQPTTASRSAAFSFSADEQPATFECSLDGAPFAPCDSPREYAVGLGEHTFQVQATDLNENTDLTPATWTWTVVDGSQPPVTVADPVPTAVSCGQVLTRSTLVENNLLNCPGEGLVIGASNIIVDLSGHTIDGPDYLLNPPATNETLPAGIRNSGFDNVTIRNGTVQQFGDGALLKDGATSNVVANVTFSRNAIAGVHLGDADNGTIRDSRFAGNAAGIVLDNGSDGNVATRNTLNGNLNMAVHVVSSSGNRIESNRISGLVSGLPGSDGGIQLEGATENVVLANTVSDTGDYGIGLVEGSHGNRIEANTLTRTGDSGVQIQDSDGNSVIGNVAREAADNGIGLNTANDGVIQGNDVRFNPDGIEVEGASSGNRIESNTASDASGIGIWIADGGLSNTVVLNTASRNGAQGILVDGVALEGSGNLVEGNRTHENLGGGIRVAGSGHTITGNVANDNASWGIFAAAGNTDGGGNTADGNAEPGQCFGVVCGVSDHLAPQTTITSGPATPTTDTTASFSFTSSEADSTFECALDAAPFGACASPAEYTGLAVGPHQLRVRAIDPSGNVDASPASHSWTVEAPAPNTPVGSNVTVELEASDGATATAAFASVATAGTTTMAVLEGAPPLPDGYLATGQLTYDISTTAEYSAPVTICITYDPAFVDDPVRLLHHDGGDWTDVTTSSDPVAQLVCGEVSSLSPFAVAGAPAAAPETQLFAPEAPILETEPGAAEIQFQFDSNDPLASFQCSLDGADWGSCDTPYRIKATVGEHTLRVRAVSNDGAFDVNPARHTFTVLARPIATIDLGPEDQAPGDPDVQTESRTATFTFSSDQSPSSFECRLTGETMSTSWEPCTSPKTYENLAFEEYAFEVRATNAEGHMSLTPAQFEWTVADLTPPNTTISSAPSNPTSATSATFVFSANEPATFQCWLDDLPVACSSGLTYTGLGLGSHEFRVLATDTSAQENVELEPAIYTWTIDAEAPDTTITSVQPGSVIFHFSGSDNHSPASELNFECRLDGAAYEACTSPKTYNDLSVGEHTFQVRAIDAAENVDQTPASHTWTVLDTTAPETSITGQPAATTTNVDASFTFTGSDNVTAAGSLTFQCSLDGASFEACTPPRSYASLAVGPHTFEVRAIDAAGNVDQTPANYSWTIQAPADTTAPETTITAQPPETTTETTASFSFASSESSSTFECSLNSAAFAACTPPQAYTGLAVGTHTFRVRATDAAGNVDQSPASYSWTIQSAVDCGAQQTLTTSADAWIDSASTSSNKGTDTVLKVMSKSGGNLRAVVRFNLPTMPQGCSVESATLRIYAKSAASGRTLQAYQLAGSWSEGSVTWANQPQTTGGAVTTSSGTGYREWNVAGLVQAMYSSANDGFLVRDATENQDAEQQFHSREESTNRPQLVLKLWSGSPPAPPPPPPGEGDTTPPDTTLTGQPLAATSSTSATFTFTATDNVTASSSLGFECQLDVPETSSWTACTTPRSYSSLAVGSHTFRVRAKDAAGNVDATPAVYTWTIDQTPPETVISSGPPSSTTSTSATFEFVSPETGSTFQCSLDSAAFTACASPVTHSSLAVGQHTFQVRATDAAGNVDPTPASYPWTIQSGGTPVDCGSAQTVSAAADAWIDQSSRSANKGTDSVLKVMSKSGNANMRAFVRFNLPAIPQGCVLDTAKLRLYAASASSSQRTLQAYRVNGAWTEGGITWSNAPGISGTPVATTSGTGYREWGVATLVQAMYSSGTNNGFLIRDATEGQDAEQQFNSREKSDNPPQLVITFKPAP